MEIRRVVRSFMLLISVLCICSLQSAGANEENPLAFTWPQTHSDIKADANAHFGRLPNGFTYVIYPRPEHKGISMRLRINAGALVEDLKTPGVAHFVEHMAFRGSRNIPEKDVLPLLEQHGMRIGPEVGAFTTDLDTFYGLELPDNADATVSTALRFYREISENLRFDPGEVDAARKVILEERRLRQIDKQKNLFRLMHVLFAGQRLGQKTSVIGPVTSIKAMTPEMLRAYYHAFYRPDMTTLIVVGNVDVAKMTAMIKARFADWQPAGPAPKVDFGKIRPRTLETYSRTEPETEDDEIILVWLSPWDPTPYTVKTEQDFIVSQIFINILNDRLQTQAARKDSAIRHVGVAYARKPHTANQYQIDFTLRGKAGKKALMETIGVFRNLVQNGIEKEELAKAFSGLIKTQEAAAQAFNKAENSDIATAIVALCEQNSVLEGPENFIRTYRQAQHDLTADDLNRWIKRRFSAPPTLISHTAKDLHGLDADALKAAYLQAITPAKDQTKKPVAPPKKVAKTDTKAPDRQDGEKAATWPYSNFGTPQPPVRQEDFRAFAVTRYHFANGLVLNLKPTKFTPGEILIDVKFKGGAKRFSPNMKPPLQAVMLLNRGLGPQLSKIKNEQLKNSPWAQHLTSQLVMTDTSLDYVENTDRKNLTMEMQFLMALLTDRHVDKDSLKPVKSFCQAIVENMRKDPTTYLIEQISGLTSSGDARYAMPRAAELNRVTAQQFNAVLHQGLDHTPVIITMVGDLDRDLAVKSVAATFATLPKLPENYTPAPNGEARYFPPQHMNLTLHHKGPKDQSMSYIAWPTVGQSYDAQTTRGLEVLTAILQNRAYATLREKLGLVYQINAVQAQSPGFKNFGAIAMFSLLAPGKDAAFTKAAYGIVRDLQTKQVTQAEIDRARVPLDAEWRQSLSSNAPWLDIVPKLTEDSTPANTLEIQSAMRAKVTPEMIRTLARKYLKKTRALHIAVLPEEKDVLKPDTGTAKQSAAALKSDAGAGNADAGAVKPDAKH